jgi:CubicO group peptidase (beta-lactamase class C family)
MKTSLLLIIILLFSSVVFSQINYSPETLEKIKEVENNITGRIILNDDRPSTITERMAKYNLKGMSIAVIQDYKIVWAKGYGWADAENKIPVTSETLFEPGSISKSLHALGILKLAQEKKVDLNTDINTYLTSWKFPYDSLSKGKKITLAQILSHTAGLSVHGFPGHDIQERIPTVINVLDGKKPAVTPPVRSMFEPELKFEYSGGGITISQLLLTDVTKQDYATWMYNNILKPIGMQNSSFAQPPAKDKQALCASGFYADGSPVSNKFHVYPEQAAAGLWMTPSDLANYVIDMQLAYQGNPSKVLNSEMVKLHLTTYKEGPTSLGSFIEDHDGSKYFEHGAANDGFCGDFYGSLEGGYGVVVFLNKDDQKILPEVINSVAKTYNWKNFYHEPIRKKCISVDAKTFKKYEGIYLNNDSTWEAIIEKDGEYYYYLSKTYLKMYFATPDQFLTEYFSTVKEFSKDEKGNVLGYANAVDGKANPKATKINNIDSLNGTAGYINDIAWYLLENKKYDEAIIFLKRGLQLYPNDFYLMGNLAHCYLFKNEYDKAIEIYKGNLKRSISSSYSWKNMIQQDFLFFKTNNFQSDQMDKVFSELKIKELK